MKPKIHRLNVQIAALAKGAGSPELKLYLRHLANAGKSPRTLKNYSIALTHFLGYFDGADPADITTDMLDEFFEDERRPRSAATVNLTKSAVRSFYRFLLDTEKIAKDPSRLITNARVVNKSPAVFTSAQRTALLKVMADAKGCPPRPGPMRDWMMILLAYHTGLRVAELVQVNIEDVDGKRRLELIGKGQKLRTLPVNEVARTALREYVPWRKGLKTKDGRALFVNRFGRRISTRAVERQLKTWLKKANIEGPFSPHSLRHSVATDLLHAGANLRTVQTFLGHASSKTMERYTPVDDGDMRSAVESLGRTELRRFES